MEASSADAAHALVTITLYSNPQLLELLGSGWSLGELLRVRTLSSRRRDLKVCLATTTVLQLKQLLEDQEGAAVDEQRILRMSGPAQRFLEDDKRTLQHEGVGAAEVLCWLPSKAKQEREDRSSGEAGVLMRGGETEVVLEQPKEGGEHEKSEAQRGDWWSDPAAGLSGPRGPRRTASSPQAAPRSPAGGGAAASVSSAPPAAATSRAEIAARRDRALAAAEARMRQSS